MKTIFKRCAIYVAFQIGVNVVGLPEFHVVGFGKAKQEKIFKLPNLIN